MDYYSQPAVHNITLISGCPCCCVCSGAAGMSHSTVQRQRWCGAEMAECGSSNEQQVSVYIDPFLQRSLMHASAHRTHRRHRTVTLAPGGGPEIWFLHLGLHRSSATWPQGLKLTDTVYGG
jgi:hypothetical protein